MCRFYRTESFKDWATWSPGRFDVPEDDQVLESFRSQFVTKHLWQNNFYAKNLLNLLNLVYHNHYGMIRKPEERFSPTCGNCQLVCFPTREERKENYDIIKNSGCDVSV